jgi:tRNA (cmo5U34)-methyltransferase
VGDFSGLRLKPGGKYVEGDYVVYPEKEKRLLENYHLTLKENSISSGLYHIDIPLSLASQKGLLLAAGFSRLNILWHKGEHLIYEVT